MNYIHTITRKQTPSEVDPLSEVKQKTIICDYLIQEMGFEPEKVKGVYRIGYAIFIHLWATKIPLYFT